MSPCPMQGPAEFDQMADANTQSSSPFTKYFLPGLVLGLIIGAFAGVMLTPILGGDSLPKRTGAPSTGPRDERRDEGMTEPAASPPTEPAPANTDEPAKTDQPGTQPPPPAEQPK